MPGARGVALVAAALALAAGTASAAPASWRLQDEGVQCVDPPASPGSYAVSAVGADRVQPPAETPPIAILDSGIAQVRELAGRIRTGVNVASGGSATPDNNGHGTAVASVAAASGAVRGVSPTSPVIPIKIMNFQGETTADWVVAGIQQAVKLGARVVNISAAGPPGPLTSDDRRVMAAIDQAVSKGIVVVAPTGNEGAGSVDIPASYPHVLAVGGTDASNARASFSNAGPGVDLAAPGDGVITASPAFICSSGYSLATGTSFSAPAVSGAVALLQAAKPQLDASQLMDMVRLRSGAAWSAELGFGLLDVPSVLSATAPRAQPAEVDDDVHWVRSRPYAISPRRARATVLGRVTTRLDPADVYRVQLRAGDRLSAATDARLGISLWSSKTGDYAITSGARAGLVKRATSKLANVRIRKGGSYYVAVKPGASDFAGVDYRLSLSRKR